MIKVVLCDFLCVRGCVSVCVEGGGWWVCVSVFECVSVCQCVRVSPLMFVCFDFIFFFLIAKSD